MAPAAATRTAKMARTRKTGLAQNGTGFLTKVAFTVEGSCRPAARALRRGRVRGLLPLIGESTANDGCGGPFDGFPQPFGLCEGHRSNEQRSEEHTSELQSRLHLAC